MAQTADVTTIMSNDRVSIERVVIPPGVTYTHACDGLPRVVVWFNHQNKRRRVSGVDKPLVRRAGDAGYFEPCKGDTVITNVDKTAHTSFIIRLKQ